MNEPKPSSNVIQFPKLPETRGLAVTDISRAPRLGQEDDEVLDLDKLPRTEPIALTPFEAIRMLEGLEDCLDTLEEVLKWTDAPQYDALHEKIEYALAAISDSHEIIYQTLKTVVAKANAIMRVTPPVAQPETVD